MELNQGLKGILTHEVVESDLTTNWRNDVPVLATPVLLWLAELACMNAIDGCIDPEQITVGFGHHAKHLAPTPLGCNVQIIAELVEIDNKMLTFKISAHDGQDEILNGVHTRAIIPKEPFLDRVNNKAHAVH